MEVVSYKGQVVENDNNLLSWVPEVESLNFYLFTCLIFLRIGEIWTTMCAESLKYIYLICPNMFVNIDTNSSSNDGFNDNSNTVCLTCVKYKL